MINMMYRKYSKPEEDEDIVIDHPVEETGTCHDEDNGDTKSNGSLNLLRNRQERAHAEVARQENTVRENCGKENYKRK
jgi:hypothetical protein